MAANNFYTDFSIVKDLLKDRNKIVIAGHVSPDGDSVGACFAFALCMEALGKEPIVLLEAYSNRYNYLKGKEFIYNGSVDELDADAFVSLDTSTKDRLGSAIKVFDKTELTINIDHHISNPGYAKYNFVIESSSASEVIYDVIKEFMPITKEIAECIYTGIISDTSVFRHSSTTMHTHEKIAQLLKTGVDFSNIHREAINMHSINEAKIFGHALENLVMVEGYPISYTYLRKSDMIKADADFNDVDGIVEYILNLRGVEVSFFVTERGENISKVSLRSNKLDVNSIAAKFSGGGHIKAAGATINADVDTACQMILEVLTKEYDKYGHKI